MSSPSPPLARADNTSASPSGWTVDMHRYGPRVTLFDVRLADYHEYMFVALGDHSISITMLDTSNAYFREPQTFTFARPHDWDTDLPADEALIQVWQAVGVQR